jgi:tetratricopeptide (TPR) repeat protein
MIRRKATVLVLVWSLLLAGCVMQPRQSDQAGAENVATETVDTVQVWQQADYAYSNGRLNDAQRLYAQVLERDPTNLSVIKRMAHVQYLMGNMTQARNYYTKAQEQGDGDPQLLYNQAAVNLTEAYEYLKKYRRKAGPANVSPELHAVIVAVERLARTGARRTDTLARKEN